MNSRHFAYVLLAIAACASSRPATTHRVNYPGGTKHYEYELKDGLPHGKSRSWHPNGALQSEGEYVNGVKHGRFDYFDEDGTFEHQALFYKGVEVWRSSSRSERPPAGLVEGLVKFSGAPPRLGTDEGRVVSAAEQNQGWSVQLSRDPPAPYFTSLDRTSSLSRVGLQYGIGNGADRQFGSVSRLELFGNYRFSQFGAYGQLSQASFESAPNMTLGGRRTLELGGTYQPPLADLGALSMRLGLLLPVGNDSTNGYLAASAAASQRPTDAAESFPGTVAVRTGASLARSFPQLVTQADAGVDWILGGTSKFDAMLHANAGVGFGVRSLMLSIELSNAIRLSDPERRLHVLGLGGTFWMERMWLSVFGSASAEGHAAVTGSVGYEL